jgi:hypothetical protein
VQVDKARRHQLAGGIDGAIHSPVKAPPDVHNALVFKDHHALAQDGMTSVLIAHNPAAADECTHDACKKMTGGASPDGSS